MNNTNERLYESTTTDVPLYTRDSHTRSASGTGHAHTAHAAALTTLIADDNIAVR